MLGNKLIITSELGDFLIGNVDKDPSKGFGMQIHDQGVERIFLGTKEVNGVRQAMLRMMSKDGKSVVFSDEGLLQQYVVGDRNDNLDKENPLLIDFTIDSGFTSVSNLRLNLKLEKFRCYSKGVLSAETEIESQTMDADGGIDITASGGSRDYNISTPSADFFTSNQQHSTDEDGNVDYTNHFHINNHAHRLRISTYHEHQIIQAPHSHNFSIKLKGHVHEQDLGIYTFPNIPEFEIYLDNEWVCTANGDLLEFDIVSKLKYITGRHELKIVSKANGSNPKGLGRCSCNLFLKGFARF